MENKNLSNQINAIEASAKEHEMKDRDISRFKSQILSQVNAELAEGERDPINPVFLKAPDWEGRVL